MALKYPWPCSVNVSNFVTENLIIEDDDEKRRRSSINIWKEQMLCLLVSQDVAGFVNGDILPPPNEEEYKTWRRTDRLVKGWILGTIGRDLLEAVWDKDTARDVWLQLDNIFTPKQEEQPPIQEEQTPSSSPIPEEQTPSSSPIQEEQDESGSEKCSKYISVYRAALRGDWDTAEKFFKDKEELGTTIISDDSETALHLAVLAGNAGHDFVNNLLAFMPREMLAHKDKDGNTSLQNAVRVNNIAAASALIKEDPDLLRIPNSYDQLPILTAVVAFQKEAFEYLMSEHEKRPEYTPFEGQHGLKLLVAVISAEFVDIAFYVAKKHPHLALRNDIYGDTGLSIIASTDNLFSRTETFSWWQKLIYHLIPIKKAKYEVGRRPDVENASSDGASNMNHFAALFQIFSPVAQKVESAIWNVIQSLVPKVKELREKKTKHERAVELAQYLCDQILASELTRTQAFQILERSIRNATMFGTSEIVEMIIHDFPMLSRYRNPDTGTNVFMDAARLRFENVINLMYNMSDRKYIFFNLRDKKDNNIMHICARLAPTRRLNLVAGAALQMQRELQWFKEMENFVSPHRRLWHNKEGETPQMIFTREHEKLKIDGEKWMKDTASACTITAALIATVMFAAAFTVPGGLESTTGIPLFTGRRAFKVFAVSDAISLFASITSLLMFLSILTARYAEEDFLYVLPKRLSIGLLSLFISITGMLVAFSATLYLVLRRDIELFPVLLSILVCFPLTSLVLLQAPLFVAVVYSTYGPGIFGKKGKRILY